jgi:hypothetical protein
MAYSNYQLNQRINNLYSSITSIITGKTNIQLSTTVYTIGLNSTTLASCVFLFPVLPSNPVSTFAGLSLVLSSGTPSGVFTITGYDYNITKIPINAEYTITLVNNSGHTGSTSSISSIVNKPPSDPNTYSILSFSAGGVAIPTGKTCFITLYRVSLTTFIFRATTLT